MAGEINNMGGRVLNQGVQNASTTRKPVTAKKTTTKTTGGKGRASEPRDEFVSQPDINSDTLDKIPQYAQKYFTKGNKIKPLYDKQVTPENSDDEIFSHVEDMIRGAKSSVQIEMFSLDKKSIVDTLIDEAKKGKKVQVIMDPPNDDWESARKGAIDKLRKGGVDVQIYPAKEAGSPGARYGQIDHVKMMIVDGKKAIIGGMNWGEHSPNNRDFDVKVEGPAVSKMGWMFRKDWEISGGNVKDLPYIKKNEPVEGGTAMANLVTTSMEKKDKSIKWTVNRAIREAKNSIHAQLFVLSDRQTIGNLIAAKKRGVDVKVMINPLKIEGNPINERGAKELKEAGVPVRWFKCDVETKQKLHAKMATFDDDQSIVGSANWTYYGFNVNREAGLEILSKDVNRDLDRVFMTDWENKTTAEPQYLEHADNNAGG